MSRIFTAASSQYLSTTTLPIASLGYPNTLACWFWVNDVAANYTLMSWADSGSVNTRLGMLSAGAVASDPLRANATNNAGTSQNADTTTSVTANTWHHACAVFTSAASRTIYLNAGGSATNSTSLVTAWNNLGIGARVNSTIGTPLDGQVAWAGVWDVALSAAEILSLSLGFHPAIVRPSGLVEFFPIYGITSPEPSQRTDNSLTLTGTPTQGAQPNLIFPGRAGRYVPTAGAAATFAPTMAMTGIGS